MQGRFGGATIAKRMGSTGRGTRGWVGHVTWKMITSLKLPGRRAVCFAFGLLHHIRGHRLSSSPDERAGSEGGGWVACNLTTPWDTL